MLAAPQTVDVEFSFLAQYQSLTVVVEHPCSVHDAVAHELLGEEDEHRDKLGDEPGSATRYFLSVASAGSEDACAFDSIKIVPQTAEEALEALAKPAVKPADASTGAVELLNQAAAKLESDGGDFLVYSRAISQLSAQLSARVGGKRPREATCDKASA